MKFLGVYIKRIDVNATLLNIVFGLKEKRKNVFLMEWTGKYFLIFVKLFLFYVIKFILL